MNTLELIIHYGLAVRKIPDKTISVYSLHHIQRGEPLRENCKIIIRDIPIDLHEHVRTDMEKEKNDYPDRPENLRTYVMVGGKPRRRFIEETTVPDQAGWWLCQPSPTATGATMVWNKKKHNLAPTLEASVQKYVQTLLA